MSAVSFSVIVATVLAVCVVYLLIRRILLQWRFVRSQVIPGAITRGVTWILVVIALPFAWFFGFVIGGNFGGALAGNFAEGSGITPRLIIPLGIGAGVFFITSLGAMGAGLLGFILGGLIEKIRGLFTKREK